MKIPKKTSFILILVLISLLIIFISSCMSHANYSNKFENITIALKWVHQSQFTGNYVAIEKGFYKDSGLNVRLIPYDFKNFPIDLVANGKAEFGIAGADEVLIARSKGLPIKAIAVIYQSNPVCAFALKESGIRSPYDFVGKRIGIEKGTNVEYEYIAMMQRLNISRSNITEISIGPVAEELINKSVDVSTGYIINEPFYAEDSGYEINIMMVEDYGVDMYADVLFTTDSMILNNPKLVEDVTADTLKGWQYSIEHQDEALDIVMKYAVNKNANHEKYSLIKSIPLISNGDIPLGMMNDKKWSDVQDILANQDMIATHVLLSDVYTNTFVEKYYDNK